jgi:NADH-quinone oxidoreductase subunit F
LKSLDQLREKYKKEYQGKATRNRIVVGLGTCGIAAGGDKVMAAIKEQVAARKLDVDVDFTSCIGMCFREPMVEVPWPGRQASSTARSTPTRWKNSWTAS